MGLTLRRVEVVALLRAHHGDPNDAIAAAFDSNTHGRAVEAVGGLGPAATGACAVETDIDDDWL
jgi:hypothetical protein